MYMYYVVYQQNPCSRPDQEFINDKNMQAKYLNCIKSLFQHTSAPIIFSQSGSRTACSPSMGDRGRCTLTQFVDVRPA